MRDEPSHADHESVGVTDSGSSVALAWTAYDDATGTDAVMSGFPVTTTYTLSNNYTRSMADGLAAAVR
jgi:hypothetical protein